MALLTILLFYIVLNPLTRISTHVNASSDHGSRGNETDLMALLTIKSKITQDPQGVLSSWNEAVDFCLWKGVICAQSNKRVAALDLTAYGLVGTLSPYVGNLSSLQELRLSNNTLTGHIPSEIGRLYKLQELNLIRNSFEGEIPANLSACSNLDTLRLGHNKLVGEIPLEIGTLTKLQTLDLDYNNLTGDISSLANLTSLKTLLLSGQTFIGNGFHGKLPDFIGKFKNLTILGLGGNSFSGVIPPSYYNLSSLQIFSVSTNLLEGSLPPDIGFYFPQLLWFQIGQNQFTRRIPLSSSNFSNAEVMDVSLNNFTGKFLFDARNMPNLSTLTINLANLGTGEADDLKFLDTLVNCTQLDILDAGDNYFGGNLPDSVANLSTKITMFLFPNNQISGSIPIRFKNLLNLHLLSLRGNQLTGTIPADIGEITTLEQADFSSNQLSGIIPSSLGNLSLLSSLNLSRNSLKGTVPTTLGNCKSLLELDVSQNSLEGEVPQQIFQALALVELHLDQNYLQGSIPSEIGDLKSLVFVDMSKNNLSGEIPISLSQCIALTHLYLEGNSFVGLIPESVSLLKDLQVIDLSRNKLYGQIPKQFSDVFSMVLLNLSFNNLEGEVPTVGVFRNVSAISLAGNNKLCGGIRELQLPRCTIKESKHKKLSRELVIVVSVSCALVGLAIMISATYVFTKSRRRQASSSGSLFKEPFLKVSYDMLLKATDGFSPGNLIGAGGFGTVFKGTLLQDGKEEVVAIKVLNTQHQGAARSFITECEALRVIRHRNLVGIITACSSIDFQGNQFRALVYEFMSKGTLESWLHTSQENVQLLNLSLFRRLGIAIDVAHALDYIHNDCDTPVIHCDLKPNNILLDDNMTARLADFGLAKLIPEMCGQLHNSISIGVRGTVGYAAPEYGLGSSVSAAGDVYSYGIILLEMMTVKRPTDMMFDGDLSLHKFAKSALPNQLTEILDPRLQFDDDEEPNVNLNDRIAVGGCAMECIKRTVEIGVQCSSELPQDRMNIKDVIRMLQTEKELLHECKMLHEHHNFS